MNYLSSRGCVMANLKKIQKSIRMTEQIYKVIDDFEGKGFNEKFQNFVLHAIESEDNRQVKLQRLDKEIAERERTLDGMKSKIDDTVKSLREISVDINSIIYRRY